MMKLIGQNLSLLRNEFRSLWKGIVIIFAIQIIHTFVSFHFRDISSHGGMDNPFIRFFFLMGNHFFYLYSLLFLFSLLRDKQKASSIQNAQIEPFRGLSMFYRFVILNFCMLVMIAYLMYRVYHLYYVVGPVRADPRVVAGGIVQLFSGPYIALCLVCPIWGVINIVGKYRHIAAVVVGILGMATYRSLISSSLKNHWQIVPDKYQAMMDMWSINLLLLTLIIGAVYYLVGLLLYNRFADV